MSAMKQALAEAIQKILYEFAEDSTDKGIVTGWTMEIEVVGSDGDLWLKHLSSEGITAWKEAGMLLSGLDDVRAAMRDVTVWRKDGDRREGEDS